MKLPTALSILQKKQKRLHINEDENNAKCSDNYEKLKHNAVSKEKKALVSVKKDIVDNKSSLGKLDEALQRLENSLRNGDSDSDSDSDSNSDSDRDSDTDNNPDENIETSSEFIVERDENGKVTRLVSGLENEEKIPRLPKSLLPQNQCSSSNKRSSDDLNSNDRKRRVKFALSGMEKTIVETLKNYKPASNDKLPFYCRVCTYQGSSVDDLELHRKSRRHAVAVDIERKMSFCNACRKQVS